MPDFPDGALLQGDGSGSGDQEPQHSGLYVVDNGERRLIPDARSFQEAGYDPSQILVVSDAELDKLPQAAVAELAPGALVQDSLNSFLGAGHYMTTSYWLRNTGSGAHLAATTRTRTITMFGGYRGAVQMIFGAADGSPVGASQIHSFGVDGTWVGRSDRTDAWWEDYSPDWANRITSVTVFHFWNPHALADQIAKGIAIAKPVVEFIAWLIATLGGGSGKTKSA